MVREAFSFYEFFSGGGMARLGLGPRWRCMFANEWCSKKAASYEAMFGTGNPKRCPELRVQDVALLTTRDLPGNPDLVWGSFPCQDLSLAGNGAGLQGDRSGTFTPFWRLVRDLVEEGRGPKAIVLENVTGAITSHGGKDFTHIIGSLASAGYRVGALVIDAVRFLPQSRPRLFFIATTLRAQRASAAYPDPHWHPASLRSAYAALPAALKEQWVWWSLPAPPPYSQSILDLLEETPAGVTWHTPEQTSRLLALMSEVNLAKLADAKAARARMAGTVYRRTRPAGDGGKIQRAEVRFDGISGCLRTPAGGSSRQFVIVVEGESVRTRLLSSREAARLMGVPEEYPLPANYNEAYHLFGDGLAVPAVRWLSQHLLEKLMAPSVSERAA